MSKTGSSPRTGRSVTARRPAQVVTSEARPGAIHSAEMVNIFEKALGGSSAAAGEHGGRRGHDPSPPRLVAKAWVSNVAYDKRVWLDLDVLSRSGNPIHSETVPLRYLEPAGGSGDFFLLDHPVPTSGRRTAPHRVQYRLYYEVSGQVFTDGLCHRSELAI